jgi:hypothetical protein
MPDRARAEPGGMAGAATPSQRSSDGAGILREPSPTLAAGPAGLGLRALTAVTNSGVGGPARPGCNHAMRAVVLLPVLAVLAALLSACQAPSSGSPAGGTIPGGPRSTAPAPAEPPVSGAEPAPPLLPPGAALAAEARWLGELFAGTPVQVSGERDGSVRLQVPLKFAYEGATATAPKPPLQAVLDKLSQSLKRQPAARLQAAAPAPSAADRLAAIRQHLAGKGVAAWRVGQAGAAADGAVLLRLVPAPAGVRQLDDRQLPATGAVRPPPPAGSGGKS